jgi:glycosyltransferase involved in cell wall biosynthesis
VKVAVDATAIPGRRLGVGVYLTELLSQVEDDVALHVFVNDQDAAELEKLIPRATLHPVRIANRVARIAWTHGLLPRRVRRLRPDVFHGPHYEIPAGLSCPSVVTFHDPTFFTSPETHERAKVAYFTRVARSGVRRAARVIAVSEYARRGAVEHAGADPSKVDVVYEGVDLQRYVPASPDLEDPFVLFVGALAPHKNVPGLIRAFDALGLPAKLLIAGLPAWGADEVRAAVGAARNGGAIHLLGFVPDDEKIRLMQRASAFVYPSLAEGFGLPVLEAMACGAPVITTTGSAPEEFASDAAVLVPPGDEEALREALREVLSGPARAAELRRLGPERAASFSWEMAARGTVSVWKHAIT